MSLCKYSRNRGTYSIDGLLMILYDPVKQFPSGKRRFMIYSPYDRCERTSERFGKQASDREPVMRVTIIAVGKLKEKGFELAAREYLSRLNHYCRIEMIELPDEKDPGSASAKDAENTVKTEGGRILGRLKPQDHVVVLEITGKQQDSVSFSDNVSRWRDQSLSVVLVIGGSLGLSKEVRDRADETLSLSQMTFPHQLARVMLLEQLYRAFKIISGQRYHK